MLLAMVLAVTPQSPDISNLRDSMERVGAGGWTGEEVSALSADVLRVAEATSSRGTFLSAIGLAAELCRVAEPERARATRAASLRLLGQRDSDSLRWSKMVLSGFVPNFADLPREAWAAELEAYDALLVSVSSGVSSRARAEFASARIFARVFLDRHWDWLDDTRRKAALEDLVELRKRFGNVRCPGSDPDAKQTIGKRADRYESLLTRLAFGAVAPPTAGVDLDGKAFDLKDYRGQIVVLDFWATFCQPCLQLVPHVHELIERLDTDKVVYLGVCGDTDRESGRATAQRVEMTWRNLWDGPRGTDGPAASAWHVNEVGWPTVIVLDAEGRIQAKLYGKGEIEDRLEGELRRLLAEPSVDRK